MKIKIESDVFNIVDRLRKIDDGYFVVFDDRKGKFEVHNSKQHISYCFTVPYDCLDSRCIDLVFVTNIGHIDNIISEIDKNNEKLENTAKAERNDKTSFMLGEIYSYSANSSKDFVSGFDTIWS